MRRFAVYILILPLLLSCVTQRVVTDVELIAHAGGALDGYVYTNSREALERAAAVGYKFIEVDLIMTSDSVLVAAHSWEDFNRMTGCAEKGGEAPRFSDFVSRKIHERYTPLSADSVNSFFMRNPKLYLVVDKISSPCVLENYFPDLKERMIVEAFNYDDYCSLIDKGYFRVLYSCMASDFNKVLVKNLLFHRFFKGRRIEWLALHTSGLNHRFFRFLDRTRCFNIALFTVDNYDEILEKYRSRVAMIYTNTLLVGQGVE